MPDKFYHSIQLPPPGGEISRKTLNVLIRRFLHLHRQRLLFLNSCLNPRQRDCLEILPLLFHHHHPALPGYCEGKVPAGISDYRASSITRKAIKRIAPGFDYRRRGIPEAPIYGLFLMGSVGSVAWSGHSDLDLWVCHHSALDAEDLANLRTKCHEIERWAGGQGLEIHCFLVNPDDFRRGRLEPLSKESSGSTQHILLLEEFYRTSLYLAGRRLLWWLVPPDQENHYREYADYLLNKRFIDQAAFIDLGGLENIPPGEFVSAGLWHLYKALDAPYKALLKLQLLLGYASEYPKPEWIATRIKQAVYTGQLTATNLDPYICLYRKVEQHLIREKQHKLIPLIQRSFVIKTRAALDHPHLRHQLLGLLSTWGWQTDRAALYQIHPPSIESLQDEWHTLVQSLEAGYRTLLHFYQRDERKRNRNSKEIRLLGRKLRAVLEKRPGKVEIVRLTTTANLTETTLFLYRERSGNGNLRWRVGRGSNQKPVGPTLYDARHLIEIIAWAQANHLITPATHWNTAGEETIPSSAELRYLSQAVRQFLANVTEPDMDAYLLPAKFQSAALFPNIATPTRPLRGGYEITSERFDPLAYGSNRQVLIQHLELLTRNSWGELQVNRHEGLSGLFDCLCQLYETGGVELDIETHCYASRTIALSLTDLYRNLAQTFSNRPSSRFVVYARSSYYLFQHQTDRLGWWEVGDETALEEALGQPRKAFSTVSFNSRTLTESPLPFLYQHNQPERLQMFLWNRRQGVEIFLLDERGALFHDFHNHTPFLAALNRYTNLFQMLDRRYAGNRPLEIFQLEGDPNHWQLRKIQSTPGSAPSIDVRLYAEEIPHAHPGYTLVCNGREFSSEELGKQVFAEAARYIHQLRQSNGDYPLYVSDIDVPPSVLGLPSANLIHTAVLLAYKRRLEQRLNLS